MSAPTPPAAGSSILRLILTIALIGLIVWVILAFVPLPPPFGTVLIAVAVIACLIVAYRALGGPPL